MYFIYTIHVLAVFSCLIAVIPIAIKVVLLAGVLVHLLFSLQQNAKFTCIKLRYSPSQSWQVAMAGSEYSSIQILSSTVTIPRVIFLHYKKQSGKKQSMLIFNDAISPEAFRALTVELRINSLN